MPSDRNPPFGGGLRPSNDTALEESGLIGARRRWSNINRYEVVFLVTALLAAAITDGLTIYRLATVETKADSDVAYGIIILVTSVFLLLFLSTGIFQQRITDIIVFFVCALLMTIYVIAHYVYRLHYPSQSSSDSNQIRLVRLICTCVFNVLFIPLSIIVIRDYERDEFAKRLFGAFPAARFPLRCYNVMECIARINTMLSISVFLLNLYNFNDYEVSDTVLLCIGIPISLIWLGMIIGMIRLENYALVGVFGVIWLFQPGFLIYCLYSDTSSPEPSTTPSYSNSTTTPFLSNSTLTTIISSTAASPFASIPVALYVCIGLNLLTHLASMVCAVICVKNFNKGLKEKVFNNRIDRWLQGWLTRA